MKTLRYLFLIALFFHVSTPSAFSQDDPSELKLFRLELLIAGFRMGKYQVTQDECEAFRESNLVKVKSAGEDASVEEMIGDDARLFVKKQQSSSRRVESFLKGGHLISPATRHEGLGFRVCLSYPE